MVAGSRPGDPLGTGPVVSAGDVACPDLSAPSAKKPRSMWWFREISEKPRENAERVTPEALGSGSLWPGLVLEIPTKSFVGIGFGSKSRESGTARLPVLEARCVSEHTADFEFPYNTKKPAKRKIVELGQWDPALFRP